MEPPQHNFGRSLTRRRVSLCRIKERAIRQAEENKEGSFFVTTMNYYFCSYLTIFHCLNKVEEELIDRMNDFNK